jgi:hypothetical protein
MQSIRRLKGRAVSGNVVVVTAEVDAAACEAGATVAASRASTATGSSVGNGADGGAVGPAVAASAEEAVVLLGTAPLGTALFETELLDTALLETALLDTALLETAPLDTTLLETALLETALLETALLETALSLSLERSMESHAVMAHRGRWVTHTSCSTCESKSSSRPKRGATTTLPWSSTGCVVDQTAAAGSAVVEALSAKG